MRGDRGQDRYQADSGGGQEAQAAHRAVRPVCDEYQGRDIPSIDGFQRRAAGGTGLNPKSI